LALHAEFQTQAATTVRPMDRLADLLAVDLAEVERLLAERAASPVATIPDLSSYLISAGGKRLRPVLTLAACPTPAE
jgi:octaprenyl-diphosphate synthase